MLIAWISISGLGLLLGRYFRVFVLAPAFATYAVAITAASMIGKLSVYEALELFVLTTACLQISYLIGVFTRSAGRASRAQGDSAAGRTSETALPTAKS